MIAPTLSSLYQWTLTQDSAELQVSIPLPFIPFDTELLQVSLSRDRNAILAEIPGELPIVSGTLFGGVSSFSLEAAADRVTVRLVKALRCDWPLLISGADAAMGELDPKSAFELFLASQERAFFDRALSVGYAPALILAFEWSLAGGADARERGMALLCLAANRYEDPHALLALGDQLCLGERTRDQCFDVYQRAVAAGTIRGLARIGRLISPLSDVPYAHKNAARAVQLFEQVIERMEDPVALAELARLVFNGIGIDRDVRRAEELHARALARQPGLRPLAEARGRRSKKKRSPVLAFYRGAAFIGFAIAGMYVFVRIWWSRHV
jgi:hypothetical protein